MQSLALCAALAGLIAGDAPSAPPVATDDRITIELFAAQPLLVTPTGIDVDAAGRVFVIESHTHFRPPDYTGPPADRIRCLVDTDHDGRADRATTFYEGTRATMNLAWCEDRSLFVATRSEIFRLHDPDQRGTAQRREEIARLETAGDYPHNGLSGFAFDRFGYVYFGLGENLGADYRLVGSDGSEHRGGGEGGSIFRCRLDGSRLERVATGFWNPFHLTFDPFGRLFAVDNDPDSRPPCRLLHIVQGGDYGYRYRNGRKGVHPFTAWNGELPGMLPMVAGTGEAPSGVLAYESDGLPDDYRGTLLGTSWGDHRLERFRLEPRGASLRATAEPIVAGGDDFRPVGIALAPDGSLYVSDWVDKSYTLHGKGRVWHVRSKQPRPGHRPTDSGAAARSAHRPSRTLAAARLASHDGAGREVLRAIATGTEDPAVRADALSALVAAGAGGETARQLAESGAAAPLRALAARFVPDDGSLVVRLAGEGEPPEVRAAALRRLASPRARDVLLRALASDDPFVRQAAVVGVRQSLSLDEQIAAAAAETPAVRLGMLMALRESADARARTVVPRLLEDPDAEVRFAAVQWVAEARLTEYRDLLASGLARGASTRQLFEAYLAALERLAGLKRIPSDEQSGEQYVAMVLCDPNAVPAVRRGALRALRPDHPLLTPELVEACLTSSDRHMQLEIVRTLRERKTDADAARLAALAAGAENDVRLRAEAAMGLDGTAADETRSLLLDLACGEAGPLRDEASRSLRGTVLRAGEAERLNAAAARGAGSGEADGDRELVEMVVDPQRRPPRPPRTDTVAWLKLLAGPADAAAGERIFFHPRAGGCFRCHQSAGRGGTIGPDLSAVATIPRRRLLESLLEPAKEIAPQFTVWNVEKHDGTSLLGVLLGERLDTGERIYGLADGRSVAVRLSDVARTQPQATSIMPDNLPESLTVQELRDLLAYLQTPR